MARIHIQIIIAQHPTTPPPSHHQQVRSESPRRPPLRSTPITCLTHSVEILLYHPNHVSNHGTVLVQMRCTCNANKQTMNPERRDINNSGELEKEDDIPVFTPLPSPALSVAISSSYMTPRSFGEVIVDKSDETPPARESGMLQNLRTRAVQSTRAVHDLAMQITLQSFRDGLTLLISSLLGFLFPPVTSSLLWGSELEVGDQVALGFCMGVVVVWGLLSEILRKRELAAAVGEMAAVFGELNGVAGGLDAVVGGQVVMVGELHRVVGGLNASVGELDAFVGEQKAFVDERA